MEVTNANLEWTPDDTATLASFLNTPTGRRFVPKLAESAPRLLAAGDTNAILIRNGQLLGFQAAVQALLDLSVVVPQVTPATDYGEYPPLDDDNAWGDLKK